MKKALILAIALIMITQVAPAARCAFAAVHDETIMEKSDSHAAEKSGEKPAHEGEELGTVLPLWSILPFAGILLSIALFPLLAPHFWEHHYAKVSAFWALVFAIPFLLFFKTAALEKIIHIYVIDYIPFIILLWSLFTIAGGINVKGTLKGNPGVNTVILLIGTLLASWIGTTGASMLLIRPILRSNAWRLHKVHTIVFFIFLVSNIGGALTPLGDPPLFLGFLHGVPFFWTLHLLPHMGFAVAVLLVVYFLLDSYYYRKEDKSNIDTGEKEPLRIEGAHNFLFLAGVVGFVLFSGVYQERLGGITVFFHEIHQSWANFIEQAGLILMGLLSLLTTSKVIRKRNEFTWGPIKEVAYLFAGIFMTIIPAITILLAGERGALAFIIKSAETPAHYFWASGLLSSFLDNAPTYLTFFNTALGKFYTGIPEATAVKLLIVEKVPYLAAISAGAVFMGANTYIGNAPNFMVKSIAESSGVKMPSFFGYIFKYSIPFLVLLFIIITFIFF